MFHWSDGLTQVKLSLACMPCDVCKKQIDIGLPLCSEHSVLTWGLRIGASGLPETGVGLWTTRAVSKGEPMCPYYSEPLTQYQLDARYNNTKATCPYVVQTDDSIYWDAARVRGLAACANTRLDNRGRRSLRRDCNAVINELDADDLKRLSPTLHKYANYPWLYAIRDLSENREVFVYYGTQFRVNDARHETTWPDI